jgi:hypothetical protein
MSTPEPIVNVAALEARLKVLETAALAKEHAFAAWLKKEAVHYANFAGIAVALAKLFGKL